MIDMPPESGPEPFTVRTAGQHSVAFLWLAFSLWWLVTLAVVGWWLFNNQDIALVLMLYVTVPIGLLWLVVRVIRLAWTGE